MVRSAEDQLSSRRQAGKLYPNSGKSYVLTNAVLTLRFDSYKLGYASVEKDGPRLWHFTTSRVGRGAALPHQ